jgi:hypothetical protein
MLATFIIEIIGALYVVFRYKMTPVSRLATGILVGLAAFQLAEYNVCEGAWGVDSLTWARIGYVAITLLPPLGLHLATKIANKPQKVLVGSAYGLAAAFGIIFLFVGHGMQSQECLGNYVIFKIAHWATIPYALYYYGLLLLTVGHALRAAKGMKNEAKASSLRFLQWDTLRLSCQRLQLILSTLRPLRASHLLCVVSRSSWHSSLCWPCCQNITKRM